MKNQIRRGVVMLLVVLGCAGVFTGAAVGSRPACQDVQSRTASVESTVYAAEGPCAAGNIEKRTVVVKTVKTAESTADHTAGNSDN